MKALVLAAWLFRFLALASSIGLLCLAHPRLRQRRVVQRSFAVVRWALALLMILYGVVKLTGTQLHHRGLLLAKRVTSRLGVLLTLVTLANIVVMDFAFDIEPKYWALSLLLATVALLLQELPAYWTAAVALTRSE